MFDRIPKLFFVSIDSNMQFFESGRSMGHPVLGVSSENIIGNVHCGVMIEKNGSYNRRDDQGEAMHVIDHVWIKNLKYIIIYVPSAVCKMQNPYEPIGPDTTTSLADIYSIYGQNN